ncbi:MAG: FAD-binding protein [Deltaproteobacteria bacterium]|nr:FAD-binding protein [Deltaproteobacteria bacterium]
MKILIDNINMEPGCEDASLELRAAKNYKSNLKLYKILRKSIDARKKGRVIIKYRAVFMADDKDVHRLIKAGCTIYHEPEMLTLEKGVDPGSVLIVGSGPAGLFAALRLMERGIRATILERGKCVAERHQDVALLKKEGLLNTESNVVFGEGGAGTYSDGKLTTRINKGGIEWLFEKLVEYGAPDTILFDAKPHIGTDILSSVVVNIRKELTSFGTVFHFEEKVVDIVSRDEKAIAVRTASGKEIAADHIIVACGNSARDLFESFDKQGVCLEKKGFAVGVRIEHPAEFINKAQHGVQRAKLPAADYLLTYTNKVTRRGTYSFCMCPGGEVVNSSSEQGMLCVNGMSYSKRDLPFSNSAIVVAVRPEDVMSGALGGISFQRDMEKKAFDAGGGKFFSPAMSALTFCTGKSKSMERVSYVTGFREADFSSILPAFVSEELKLSLTSFDRTIKGFVSEGVIIGVETRTSSPVRVVRGDDFQSISLKRLYPAGEGSGYAGGIVSSAVDGLRIADHISGV